MLKRRKLKIGVENPAVKLTHEQAMMAKACPFTKGAATEMAKRFGVTVTIITGIRSGKRWKHLQSVQK